MVHSANRRQRGEHVPAVGLGQGLMAWVMTAWMVGSCWSTIRCASGVGWMRTLRAC
jgi:hypothetical protein